MDLDPTQELLASFAWPSPAYLFGMLVFSIVGYVAYRFGRKRDRPLTLWIGVALMLYPYVVSDTRLLYVVGAVLCVGLWVDHRR
jgi:MFS family permease